MLQLIVVAIAHKVLTSHKETTMNLRFKLSKKITAVIQITSATTAIFSDECSPTHLNTLSIIEAETFDELKAKCYNKAIELASHTRFDPIVCVVSNNTYKVITLEPAEADESEDMMF